MAKTSKQVKQIAIQLGTYESGSFTATVDYDPAILYDVWNFDGRWRTDWLGGNANTRSLTGFDRVGVGGYRLDLRVTFRHMTPSQATKMRNLLNDLFEVPAFPRIIKISADDTIANGVLCNIRSAAFGIRREMTIGRQAVNMQFSGLLRVDTIPDSYEIASG
jgi:hypothetical protein